MNIATQIRDVMSSGHSLEAAAASAGISPRTAYNWLERHPEFLQVVEEGRAAALLFWERRAIAMANGEPGNAAIVGLALRNRSRSPSGWDVSGVSRLEVSGPQGMPVRVESTVTTIDARRLSPEQRQTFREVLLAAKLAAVPSEI